MRICDVPESEIKVGMRIKSLISDMRGTIIEINHRDDDFAYIRWDNGKLSGFYGNNCKCEVVNEN